LELPVPLQFAWSPQGFISALPTIYKDQVLDLGFIDENSDKFGPALYTYTNNFKGMVRKNEAIRYHLEVFGDICPPCKPAVVEVAWDGDWSSDMDEMSKHLIIKFL
jgi:hypothetical protein